MNYLIPEWGKQKFIQLVLPHKNTDWSCCLDEALKTFKASLPQLTWSTANPS